MLGIVLAGGFGKRMLSSTRTINKHLLPIYSKSNGSTPMIFYPINTLIKSGVKKILIITSDEAAGLMIETLGDGKRFGEDIDFTYKIQNMHNPNVPCGIASALKLCEDFTKGDPFAVILGDNFYEDSFKNEFDLFEKKFIDTYRNYLGSLFSQVFLKEVEDPQRFGVATLVDGKVTKIVEKPKEPESNYAVSGLYLFTPHVYSLLKDLKVSARGELEVSDITDWYSKGGTMLSATIIQNYWSDVGIPESMLKTTEYINKINYKLDF
jgi:glucose-1-phosphate thymidylyltransferase